MKITAAILALGALALPVCAAAGPDDPAFKARGFFLIRGYQDGEDIILRKRSQRRVVELSVVCNARGRSANPASSSRTRYLATSESIAASSIDGFRAPPDSWVLELTTPLEPLASIRGSHEDLKGRFETAARERTGAALREAVNEINAVCPPQAQCPGAEVLDTVAARMQKANLRIRAWASRLRIGSSGAFDGLDVREVSGVRLSLRERAYRLSLRTQTKRTRALSELRGPWLDDEELVPAFSIAAVGAADFYARVRARADQQWFRSVLAVAPVQSQPARAEVKLKSRGRARARFHQCLVTVLSTP